MDKHSKMSKLFKCMRKLKTEHNPPQWGQDNIGTENNTNIRA